MKRPYILCHMTISLDGKVTGDFLSEKDQREAIEQYYQIHRDFSAKAFACGRITMEQSFTKKWFPDLSAFENISMDRSDFAAPVSAHHYAIAFDRRGKLGWKKNMIEDEDPGYDQAHVIEVLCEDVSDAYLAYLRQTGISYIFAGKSDMNLALALEKLKELFGIDLLLLEGGSVLNGVFQREGFIDELSLVHLPLIADAKDKELFDQSVPMSFQFKDAKKLTENALWLRYTRTE